MSWGWILDNISVILAPNFIQKNQESIDPILRKLRKTVITPLAPFCFLKNLEKKHLYPPWPIFARNDFFRKIGLHFLFTFSDP